jgi:hypothetical protein
MPIGASSPAESAFSTFYRPTKQKSALGRIKFCAFILPNPNLFSKSVMCRTLRVRGGSELNRTLHESPATASLHSATPKRKNVSCFSVFRGGGFFLKWKGHFFLFGVLPSKYSGSVAGLQYGLGKTEKRIFWGKRIFRFASADFRPQKGVWGMNAGGIRF